MPDLSLTFLVLAHSRYPHKPTQHHKMRMRINNNKDKEAIIKFQMNLIHIFALRK